MNQQNQNSVYSVVIFRARAGVAAEQMEEARRSSLTWLTQQPGFVRRFALADADGNYLHMVEWASLEEAVRVGDAFAGAEANQALMERVDPESRRSFRGVPLQEG
ncbi:hypothetical protein [Vulgatibacter sp.]|uniref:hypothetical protein n=1 Tax=Vulgatibacter sp. TaxID=1971226 RepID=UPI0035658D14